MTSPPFELVLAQAANKAISQGADPDEVTSRLHQMIGYTRKNPSVAREGSYALDQGVDPSDILKQTWQLSQGAPVPEGQFSGKAGAGRDFTGTAGPASASEMMLEGVPFGTATKGVIDATTDAVRGRGFDYRARVQDRKQAMADYVKQHPVGGRALEVAGAAIPAILSGGVSAAAEAPTIGGKIGQAILQGLDYGTLQGASQVAGSGQTDPDAAVRDVATNAAVGAGLAPLGIPVSKAAGYVAGKAAPMVSRMAQSASDRMERGLLPGAPGSMGEAINNVVSGYKDLPSRLASSIGPRGKAATMLNDPIQQDLDAGYPIEPPAPGVPNRALTQGGPNLKESAFQITRRPGAGRAVIERGLGSQMAALPSSMEDAIEAASGAKPGMAGKVLDAKITAQLKQARRLYDIARDESDQAAALGKGIMSPSFDEVQATPAGQAADRYAQRQMANFRKRYAEVKVLGPVEPAGGVKPQAPPEEVIPPSNQPGAPAAATPGAPAAPPAPPAPQGMKLNPEWQRSYDYITKTYGGSGNALTPEQIEQALEKGNVAKFVPEGAPEAAAPAPTGPDPLDPGSYQTIKLPTPEYMHFYKIALNRLTRGLDEAGNKPELAVDAAGGLQLAQKVRDELPDSWRRADDAFATAARNIRGYVRGLKVYGTQETPPATGGNPLTVNPRRMRDLSLQALENEAKRSPAGPIQEGAGNAMQVRWGKAESMRSPNPARIFPEEGTTGRQTRLAMRPPMGPSDLAPKQLGPNLEPTPEQKFYQTVRGWDNAKGTFDRVLGGSQTGKRVPEGGDALAQTLSRPSSIIGGLRGRAAHILGGTLDREQTAAQQRMQQIIDRHAADALVSDNPSTLPNLQRSHQDRMKMIAFMKRFFPQMVGSVAPIERDRNQPTGSPEEEQ